VSALRRIVMIRHGETVGNSRVRLHGANDLNLSEEGRGQMRAASRRLAQEVFEVVAASPLRRSWQSASIVARGAPVMIVPEFREIDFGRWEGLSSDEVQAADPVLYKDWKARAPGFEYPGGELRASFRKRVSQGFARIEHSGAQAALLVVHKGVIRAIAEQLLEQPLADGEPELGVCIDLGRDGQNGAWFRGRRSSDPPPLRKELCS
jgi:broad specificity phosphatase PhoE